MPRDPTSNYFRQENEQRICTTETLYDLIERLKIKLKTDQITIRRLLFSPLLFIPLIFEKPSRKYLYIRYDAICNVYQQPFNGVIMIGIADFLRIIFPVI
jgi:hypothetical protein